MVPDLNDKSLMPFGKHKGEQLANIPAAYFIYIYENFTLQENLKKYIEDNLAGLREEKKRANREQRR